MSTHTCFKWSHTWMLKLNLVCNGMVIGKLNQWKICISHYVFWSTERSSLMNIEGKNGHQLVKKFIQQNFKLPMPPKFGSLLFLVLTEMENCHWLLWKNWKMAAILWKIVVQQNSKLLIPQKFGFLLFLVSMETENWHQPVWENSHHFARNHCTMKFQITDCPQRLALCFS